MPGSGERAYAYAKACGIIGKSFLPPAMGSLASVRRLSELDRLVFPHTSKDLPERELLPDLERRIIQRSADQIVTLVRGFKNPPELLVRLVRSYEYADMANVLGALSAGENAPPAYTDIGPFRTVRFEAYPDLKAMTAGSEFSWLLKEDVSGDTGGAFLQTRLDQQYYRSLWTSLSGLAKKDSMAAEKILSEEIALRNAAWVLRLRCYYAMSAEEIRRRLVFIPQAKPGKKALPADEEKNPLVRDALAALTADLDTFAEWRSWKRFDMLNAERPGEHWRADPRYFQNASAHYLYRLAKKLFRRRPFSIDTMFCFIKLKLFEEDILTNAAEGLSLGMASAEVFSLLEAPS